MDLDDRVTIDLKLVGRSYLVQSMPTSVIEGLGGEKPGKKEAPAHKSVNPPTTATDHDKEAQKSGGGKIKTNNKRELSPNDDGQMKKISFRAPPGRMGLAINFSKEGGRPFITEIEPKCPFKTQLKTGDQLLSIAELPITRRHQLSFRVNVERDFVFARKLLAHPKVKQKRVEEQKQMFSQLYSAVKEKEIPKEIQDGETQGWNQKPHASDVPSVGSTITKKRKVDDATPNSREGSSVPSAMKSIANLRRNQIASMVPSYRQCNAEDCDKYKIANWHGYCRSHSKIIYRSDDDKANSDGRCKAEACSKHKKAKCNEFCLTCFTEHNPTGSDDAKISENIMATNDGDSEENKMAPPNRRCKTEGCSNIERQGVMGCA